MTKKIFITIGVIAVIAIGIFFYLNKEDKKQETVKIGVILSLSENGASYGNRSLHGILVAQEELNTHNFFKNNKLELIVEDTKTNASTAVMAFEKLNNINHVPVVVGMVMSDEVLACAKLANHDQIVILTPGAGSTDITNAGPYIFRNRESATIQADAVAKACVEMNKSNVAILYSHAANGISYKDAFKKALLKYNGNVVVEIGYNEGLNDYRTEIKKIVGMKPDAIYIAGVDREIGLILRQSTELKNDVQIFASAGAVTTKLIESAGKSAEGLISVSEAFDPTDNDVKDSYFVKAYTQKYGESPEWVAANSYEAMMLIGQLIENGCYTGTDFKHALDTIHFHSFSGILNFDENGDVVKTSRLLKVENGKFVKYLK